MQCKQASEEGRCEERGQMEVDEEVESKWKFDQRKRERKGCNNPEILSALLPGASTDAEKITEVERNSARGTGPNGLETVRRQRVKIQERYAKVEVCSQKVEKASWAEEELDEEVKEKEKRKKKRKKIIIEKKKKRKKKKKKRKKEKKKKWKKGKREKGKKGKREKGEKGKREKG